MSQRVKWGGIYTFFQHSIMSVLYTSNYAYWLTSQFIFVTGARGQVMVLGIVTNLKDIDHLLGCCLGAVHKT